MTRELLPHPRCKNYLLPGGAQSRAAASPTIALQSSPSEHSEERSGKQAAVRLVKDRDFASSCPQQEAAGAVLV